MRERRRRFTLAITICLSAVAMVAALAQAAAAEQAVPVLLWRNSPGEQAMIEGLREGLKESGLADSVSLKVISAEGSPAKAQELAKQVVSESPTAIVAVGAAIGQAVLQATDAVPVILLGVIDPVASKLVKDWGGSENNAVAASRYVAERQRVEYTLTLLPSVRRWAIVGSTDLESKRQADELSKLGDELGLLHVSVGLSDTANGLVGEAKKLLADADLLFVVDDGLVEQVMPQLVEAAGTKPVVGSSAAALTAGAFTGLAVDNAALGRQGARLLGEAVAGVPTANLPSEAPDRVEFIINLKTARTLGLTVPLELLAAADQVIE